MKSGLFFSKDALPPLISNLKNSFNIDCVKSIKELQKKLYSLEYEFVYLDLNDENLVLKIIYNAFKLDAELIVITHIKLNFPKIENFHIINQAYDVKNILEILSFHEAKTKGVLQVEYHENYKEHDYFYLGTASSQGVVLTDAEDSIFYMNQAATTLLNQDDSKKLMRQYLRFDRKDSDGLCCNKDSCDCFYEFVSVVDSNLSVSVLHKEVRLENEKTGSVYFLNDVTDENVITEKLIEEKGKYQKLTSRLNEVILKETDFNVYNLAYLKRKLDLEIRHAKRMQNDSRVIYIGIKDFEKQVTSVTLKKSILNKATGFLIGRFSDPHVVGSLSEGRWLVVLQSNDYDIPKNFRQFCAQMTEYLNSEYAVVNLCVHFIEFVNLKKYKNSQELLKTLPLYE